MICVTFGWCTGKGGEFKGGEFKGGGEFKEFWGDISDGDIGGLFSDCVGFEISADFW